VKAVVTGGAGFVGGHLVAHLTECGDDVTTLDRHGDNAVDVTDADAVRDAITAVHPDVVFHLAAVSHVGASWDAPALVFQVNAEGTLHVLRACSEARVARVVVVGSADVYGAVTPADLPLGEDAPLRPMTPYGASKAAADVLALQAFLGDGLATLRVRAFNHTGPGQPPRFLVPALAARIARAERDHATDVALGSLEPVRDLGDVRDVVRAYRLLAERGEPGEAYNVCTGHGVSVADIADHLVKMSPRQLQITVDPDLVRPVDVPRLVGDPAKLHEATGWEPQVPFDETLHDVLAAARAAV
jgi:GDP-4-dehydro-6-deoxy-D-mannose reductase